jgi:hypothetical protein
VTLSENASSLLKDQANEVSDLSAANKIADFVGKKPTNGHPAPMPSFVQTEGVEWQLQHLRERVAFLEELLRQFVRETPPDSRDMLPKGWEQFDSPYVRRAN